jgi:hypothetical protein
MHQCVQSMPLHADRFDHLSAGHHKGLSIVLGGNR